MTGLGETMVHLQGGSAALCGASDVETAHDINRVTCRDCDIIHGIASDLKPSDLPIPVDCFYLAIAQLYRTALRLAGDPKRARAMVERHLGGIQ